MSVRPASFRACRPCRDSKVRCDQVRPTCGRCARRGTNCYGYSDDIFRDQTVVAGSAVERRARMSIRRDAQQEREESSTTAEDSNDEYPPVAPWLNVDARARAPQPLINDLDHRAVEHFFSNWILYPCNHKITPGHLSDLPVLYQQSLPGESLRLAIEALAYADIPNQHLKARSKYGAALNRIRVVIADPERSAWDGVLCALLIIDNFELMHKDRSEPLGPHTIGLLHLLHVRGDGQLFTRKGFSLWRVAHHRLQARQILLRETPSSQQRAWVQSLNKSYPDLHITIHVFKISESCALAGLMLNSPNSDPDVARQQLRHFLDETHTAIVDCDEWVDSIPDGWKPTVIPYEDVHDLLSFLDTILIHHDIWVTYMWNFHSASRIAMAEAYIDVVESPTYRSLLDESLDAEAVIADRVALIQRLSLSLLETLPHLLGFVDHDGKPRLSSRDLAGSKIGKGLGGFFAMYALFVIRASRHCLPEHRTAAQEVLDWIHAQNSML